MKFIGEKVREEENERNLKKWNPEKIIDISQCE